MQIPSIIGNGRAGSRTTVFSLNESSLRQISRFDFRQSQSDALPKGHVGLARDGGQVAQWRSHLVGT